MFELPAFDAPFIVLLATIFVAGVARGMSGFGTGMIVAPVAGALYGPKAALVIMVIIDSLPTIPVTIPVLRHARWREVLPILVGLALLLPVGVYVLEHSDPVLLRWLICAAVFVCAIMLWSGWRYSGPRNAAVSVGVGGVAGLLSGIASIPGPPVIFYWLAADFPAAIVRASLLTLFLLSELLTIGNLWFAGLFTRDVVTLGLTAVPFYFAALLIGARLYGFASDATYRRVTLILVIASAILALPVVSSLIVELLGAVEG